MNENSTDCMCGEFEEDDDLPGCCRPYRLKKDCEAPTIPTLTPMEYNPDEYPPFQPA